MFIEEAEWIGQNLKKLNLKPDQTVLDLGSCSDHYRRLEQGYIDYYIFWPLRKMGNKITHVDSQLTDGVDIVCDVSLGKPKKVFEKIIPADIVIATSLLEHVESKENAIQNIAGLVCPGGYLIVTVPQKFPYHPAPIDNMYRPSPEALSSLLPKDMFIILEAETVDSKCVIKSQNGLTHFVNRCLRRLGNKLRVEAIDPGPFSVSCVVAKKRI